MSKSAESLSITSKQIINPRVGYTTPILSEVCYLKAVTVKGY